MYRIYRFSFVLVLFAFVGCEFFPTSPASESVVDQVAEPEVTLTEHSTVEGITEYSLSNGLRILLFPDQSKEQITVNITYLVGSRHEAYGETGMAHLLEHLVFKGTPNHPDIPKELSDRGAFPNGTTWLDRTNYFETFSATEDNLEWALDLEADRMVNSYIKKSDLDSEMTVVRNEFESGENNPGRVLNQRVASAAFLWHNYGNSTIGSRSDIENVPIERLKAFYKKYYQPDNAVLIVAGKFDTQYALDLIKEKFGAIPRPDRTGSNKIYPTYTRDPAQDGERTVTLRRVGDNQIAIIAHHIPASVHDDTAALGVLGGVLSHVPSGRLYKNLVETELATSASSYSMLFKEPFLNYTSISVRKEKSLANAEAAALATIEEIQNEAPSEAEVKRIINEYMTGFENSMKNPQGIALDLSEWAAAGDWRLMFIARDRVEKVTPADVQAVAQKYFMPSNRTTGYFYPTEETPPRVDITQGPDLASLVDGYKGREGVQAGEAFDPSYDNIDARTEIVTLQNGAKVALLPKKTRGASVSVTMTFPHGKESSLTGKPLLGSYAGTLLMRGTKSMSREEIRDRLTELKAQGSVGGGMTSSSAGFTTVKESLPELFALIEELLTEPAFDEKEFELIREQRIAGIESQMSEPGAKAQLAIQKHLYPYPEGHPRYNPTFEEALEYHKNIALADVVDFWETFYGGQNGLIAIVGDFDSAEVTQLLNETFGDWKSNAEYERLPIQVFDVGALNEVIETPDKPNANMLAGMTFSLRDDDPDYPALMLSNYLLGGGFLNSRLATRIRQQDGLSYGVGSSFSTNSFYEWSLFSGYAIFAPENSDRVLNAFVEEIDRVRADGFTQEELDAGRQAIIDRNRTARAADGNLASQLRGNLDRGRTMQFSKGVDAKLQSLSLSELNETFRKYIDTDSVSFVRAGDFANVASD